SRPHTHSDSLDFLHDARSGHALRSRPVLALRLLGAHAPWRAALRRSAVRLHSAPRSLPPASLSTPGPFAHLVLFFSPYGRSSFCVVVNRWSPFDYLPKKSLSSTPTFSQTS